MLSPCLCGFSLGTVLPSTDMWLVGDSKWPVSVKWLSFSVLALHQIDDPSSVYSPLTLW